MKAFRKLLHPGKANKTYKKSCSLGPYVAAGGSASLWIQKPTDPILFLKDTIILKTSSENIFFQFIDLLFLNPLGNLLLTPSLELLET